MKKKLKRKKPKASNNFNQPGNCANCNSTNLDYHSLEVCENLVIYPYSCKDCKTTGTEAYTMYFQSNIIDHYQEE